MICGTPDVVVYKLGEELCEPKDKKTDSSERQPSDDVFVLLCCDGIWDVRSCQEAVD